jgi:hypothetical protein
MQRQKEAAMDESMRSTIDTLIAKVESKSKELAELKRTVNFLAREAGGEQIFPDDQASGEQIGLGGITPDKFYGKSPISASREYLEMRGRAVPPEEIVEALTRGGFDFDAQEWKKADRVRNLAISLSKNSVIFHRLPNGTYGLVKFYPDVQAEKKAQKKTSEAKAEAEAEEQPEESAKKPSKEESTKVKES